MAKIKAIILDVDGTIFNVNKRYVKAFELALGKQLDGEEILRLRRSGKSGKEIIDFIGQYSAEEVSDLNYKRVQLMNSHELLKMDVLIKGTKPFMQLLKKEQILIFTLTARDTYFLKAELKESEILKYVDGFYESQLSVSPEFKFERINQIMKTHKLNPSEIVMVGDCELDILAGKRAKVYTVGVLSGLSSKSLLETCNPDLIIDAARQLKLNLLNTL